MALVAELASSTEVLVVGAGLVGASTAIALAMQGLHVTLVDSQPEPAMESNGWDQRIYAISPGSKQWLESLGVWDVMDATRVADVQRMQVWGDGGALLEFDAYEANLPSLSSILEGRQLQHAMWRRIHELHIPVMAPVHIRKLHFSNESVHLELNDGKAISSPLVVAADGAHSWIREQAGLSVSAYPYEDQGVVANFDCEFAHQHVARQWFREDGILAWLPLPGKRISIVWSTRRSEELLSMDTERFCEAVAEAGKRQLGAMELITKPASFPLNKQSVDRLVRPHLALVGDAAHQVHPLAGQGVNLGFRDVITLARTLAARHPNESIGDMTLLRRYERSRRSDILAMQHTTHGLHELFARPAPMLRTLRNWGLELTNRQQWLKQQLIKQAIN